MKTKEFLIITTTMDNDYWGEGQEGSLGGGFDGADEGDAGRKKEVQA